MAIAPSPIPTLQYMAVHNICSSLWLHKIAHHHSSDIFDLLKPFEVDDSVPLPRSLRPFLNSCLRSMAGEMVKWVFVHSYRVFVFEERELSTKLLFGLKNLVWHPNGTIDYLCTAEQLLQSTVLSEMDKFKMAGLFFFKDYIYKLASNATPEDQIKGYFNPGEIYETMLDITTAHTSEHCLIQIHKRLDSFLTWYYGDFGRIVEFKFIRLRACSNTPEEPIVRKLLLGLGYGIEL